MNGFYEDTILSRLIAEENISHRERVRLEIFRNPQLIFINLLVKAVGNIKEKLQQLELVPVYCFEYAPDC